MADKKVLVDNKAVDIDKTKVTFGAISSTTPQWAKWVFRSVFILTSVATFIIAGDAQIKPDLAVRIGVYLKGLDLLAFGFSKLFGVTLDEQK